MSFVLDEHVDPAVVAGLARLDVEAIALGDLEEGKLLGASDAEVLLAARRHRAVLVTYDLKTIPPLLREWGASGTDHAGVVLVDRRSIEPQNVGLLIRSLADLHECTPRSLRLDEPDGLPRTRPLKEALPCPALSPPAPASAS